MVDVLVSDDITLHIIYENKGTIYSFNALVKNLNLFDE